MKFKNHHLYRIFFSFFRRGDRSKFKYFQTEEFAFLHLLQISKRLFLPLCACLLNLASDFVVVTIVLTKELVGLLNMALSFDS